MPIAITGMHRSGTSVVARVLYACGLYLGLTEELLSAQADNPDGFWEHVDFVRINEEILVALGGNWSDPPLMTRGWPDDPRLAALRDEARDLAARFAPHEPWGWKDPRNSLTLPFWRTFFPELKVVHSVRNPLEVAASLQRRNGIDEQRALDLWLAYTDLSLDARTDVVITHYDALIRDPRAEVMRIACAVGLTPSDVQLEHAAVAVDSALRHHEIDHNGRRGLPREVRRRYEELVATARTMEAPQTSDEPSVERRLPLTSRSDTHEQLQYTKLDTSPGSAHMLVVDAVPDGATVLDVGCATGYLAAELVRTRSSRVTGIEISVAAAEQAREHCDRVVIGDIEALDLAEIFGEERFDVVLFADVLEHLRDPETALRKVRPFVAPHGRVVASIPNIGHISVRLALLGGEFRYRDTGLLDRTHLRFFTRTGIEDLFEASGFTIETWRRRRLDLADAEIHPPPSLDPAQVHLPDDPEATTYQFVVSAYPSDAGAEIHALRTALRETRHELDRLRSLRDVTDELTRLRNAHEALERRLVAERTAFANHLQEFASPYRQEAQELRRRVTELAEEIEWRAKELEWRRTVDAEQKAQLETLLQRRSLRLADGVAQILRRKR